MAGEEVEASILILQLNIGEGWGAGDDYCFIIFYFLTIVQHYFPAAEDYDNFLLGIGWGGRGSLGRAFLSNDLYLIDIYVFYFL